MTSPCVQDMEHVCVSCAFPLHAAPPFASCVLITLPRVCMPATVEELQSSVGTQDDQSDQSSHAQATETINKSLPTKATFKGYRCFKCNLNS